MAIDLQSKDVGAGGNPLFLSGGRDRLFAALLFARVQHYAFCSMRKSAWYMALPAAAQGSLQVDITRLDTLTDEGKLAPLVHGRAQAGEATCDFCFRVDFGATGFEVADTSCELTTTEHV